MSDEGQRRRWLSIAAAVIAAILVPIAVLTLWARIRSGRLGTPDGLGRATRRRCHCDYAVGIRLLAEIDQKSSGSGVDLRPVDTD